MFNVFVTFYNWIYVFFTLIAYFPISCFIWLLTRPFDKKLRLLHVFTSFWGYSFVLINPFLKIKIEGTENIKRDQAYVMICNHQSMLDIAVLFGIFKHFKWVAKKELFKIPIVGWNMSLNGYIAVDRANKQSHAKMFAECEKNLQMGNSIMIFPEGTRSANGQIQYFKEGAFKIALASQKPILPIVLDGTSDALPKKGLVFKKLSTIRVKIYPAISYEEFANLTAKELSIKMRVDLTEKFNQFKTH